MTNALSYAFTFRPIRTETGSNNSNLAYCTAKIYIGDAPMLILEGCTLKDNGKGIWLAPPSKSYVAKDGTTKYQKFFYLFPTPEEGAGDNAAWRTEFNNALQDSWNDFCSQDISPETETRPAPVQQVTQVVQQPTRQPVVQARQPQRLPSRETQPQRQAVPVARPPVRLANRPAPVQVPQQANVTEAEIGDMFGDLDLS